MEGIANCDQIMLGNRKAGGGGVGFLLFCFGVFFLFCKIHSNLIFSLLGFLQSVP